MATIRKGEPTPIEDDHLRRFCEALYALIGKLACYFISDLEIRREVIQYTAERIIRHRHKLYVWPYTNIHVTSRKVARPVGL